MSCEFSSPAFSSSPADILSIKTTHIKISVLPGVPPGLRRCAPILLIFLWGGVNPFVPLPSPPFFFHCPPLLFFFLESHCVHCVPGGCFLNPNCGSPSPLILFPPRKFFCPNPAPCSGRSRDHSRGGGPRSSLSSGWVPEFSSAPMPFANPIAPF